MPPRARWLLPAVLLFAIASQGHAGVLGSDLTAGGSLAVTSDYIYRGLSVSNGAVAGQADLHLQTAGGTFGGVWASTRDNHFEPYANFDVEPYLGQRFDLGGTWNATVSARAHYYVGGSQEVNDDYQEISAAVGYLDRWSLSVTAIPNAVRYWYERRLSRTPAYVADTSAQWLIVGGLYLTGGAGYYHSTGTGPGIERAVGYFYGNVGAAYEYRSWRVDVGYFLAQEEARRLFPYPIANERFAATLVWSF
jgi:uncharacterized protein (TIGR02001 family)